MSRLFLAFGLALFLSSFAAVYSADSGSCSASSSSCKCRDGRDGRDGKPGRDGRDGKDADECKRPPPPPPTPPPSGAIQFGDTAEECTQDIAGTVRYSTSKNALELCDGSSWSQLATVPDLGHTPERPGVHCLDILNSGNSRGDGFYWIDPNGGSADDSFRAYCDMETEGGGWTLFATKVTTNFLFISTTFSAAAAQSTQANAASHIHPYMTDWKQIMFRFNDNNNIRLIYERAAGSPQPENTEFEDFLTGTNAGLVRDLHGFYRYSPADQNKRHPASGFATINQFHFNNNRGISEAHVGTDRWIDMWSGSEGTDNYVSSDSAASRGTKCIAGYCFQNKPIWVMVR